MDNLTISRQFSERYSKEVVMVIARDYASVFARYGDSSQIGRVVGIETTIRALEMDAPMARMREYVPCPATAPSRSP